mgnify:CR=1 FL=1
MPFCRAQEYAKCPPFFFWGYETDLFIMVIAVSYTTLSFWIISNVIVGLVQELKDNNKILKFSTGMILAHLGVGLLIMGVTGSSIWQKETIVRMKINDNVAINNYNIVLKEVNQIKIKNYLPGKALNLGIKHSKGKFLVFICVRFSGVNCF